MGPDDEGELLVERARRGDQDAWEDLLEPLYPRIRAFVARRVAVPVMEDVVSETMTRAVGGIDRFAWGPAGFDGWVFGIARKVVADSYRRSARDHKYAHAVVGASTAHDSERPGDALELDEEHRHLRRCFDQLGESERELLELRVVAGLSAEQVAAILGKRPGAVRTAQSRALGRLRRLVEADHD